MFSLNVINNKNAKDFVGMYAGLSDCKDQLSDSVSN
jgi:hypothetical protein